MTKTIDTLVQDIHALFESDYVPSETATLEFGHRLAAHVANRVAETRIGGTLRLSNVGKPCDRQLWYSVNQPDKAESLPVSARIKFLFGDILEELLLFLAKEAGHTVEGTQDELVVSGVVGHRDAVIDGHLVDCKSASSIGYQKFAKHLTAEDDAFGYLGQLRGYLRASAADPLVTYKDSASFLVIDKQLGYITLDTHGFHDLKEVDREIENKKTMVAQKEPPPRAFEPKPDGKSGNMKLATACSYCPFKATCWPEARVFQYSDGPRYLTKVVKTPQVQEVGTF